VADLFGYPSPADAVLMCTNIRGTTGKVPVWADDSRSTFYFPWLQIRFLEIPPARNGPPSLREDESETAIALREPADEAELEIDEDFLRRVRDV